MHYSKLYSRPYQHALFHCFNLYTYKNHMKRSVRIKLWANVNITEEPLQSGHHEMRISQDTFHCSNHIHSVYIYL